MSRRILLGVKLQMTQHEPEDLQTLKEHEEGEEERTRPRHRNEVAVRGVPADGKELLRLRDDVQHHHDEEVVTREDPRDWK